MGFYDVRYLVRYDVRYDVRSLVNFLLSILCHHQRKATHQERTELGKARFLKPYQTTTKQYQHDAKDGGLPVAKDSFNH